LEYQSKFDDRTYLWMNTDALKAMVDEVEAVAAHFVNTGLEQKAL
jgi:hypothetical protein